MSILSLPLELFQEVLYHAMLARGPKRAVRLRLVCSKGSLQLLHILKLMVKQGLFAGQVVEVMYMYRMFDVKCWQKPAARLAQSQPCWHRCLTKYYERRVIREPESGLGKFVWIHQIAKILCIDSDIGERWEERYRDYVKSLCEIAATKGRTRRILTSHIDHNCIVPGRHVLVAAIWCNVLPTVRRLINRTQSPHVRHPLRSYIFGDTIVVAGQKGSHEMLELLLHCASPDVFESRRCDLLVHAAHAGRADTVQFLLHFRTEEIPWRFDIWDKESDKNRVLSAAGETPSQEIFDQIMELQRKYPTDFSFPMYLRSCAMSGWTDMACHLLRLGTYVNGPYNPHYWYPGQDPKPHLPEYWTIHHAAERGFDKIVQLLLNYKANTGGAMKVAARNGHYNIVKMLLDHGAETGEAVVNASAGGFISIVRLLLDHGADPNDGHPNPLISAVELEHTELFHLLVQRGTVLSSTATHNMCWDIAKALGSDSMLELLREHFEEPVLQPQEVSEI